MFLQEGEHVGIEHQNEIGTHILMSWLIDIWLDGLHQLCDMKNRTLYTKVLPPEKITKDESFSMDTKHATDPRHSTPSFFSY